MNSAENDEGTAAQRFAADERVMITATGRVLPRQCDLCVCFWRPKDPVRAWWDGLPWAFRSPESADALGSLFPRVANLCADEIKHGQLPLMAIPYWLDRSGHEASHAAALTGLKWMLEAEVKRPALRSKLEFELGCLEKVREKQKLSEDEERCITRLRGKGPVYENLDHAYNERHSRLWRDKMSEEAVMAFRYVLGMLGECRHDPGMRMPSGFIQGAAELRHGKLDWCGMGELRHDVTPNVSLGESVE